MRKLVLVFLVLIASTVSVQAQDSLKIRDRGHAQLTRPIKAKEELAEAFRHCRTSPLLQSSCEDYLESFQVVDVEAGLSSVSELPDFVSSLVIVPCPKGRAVMARLMLPSHKMRYDWQREFENGETCLLDNNTNRLILTMACGNVILSPRSVAMVTDLSLNARNPYKDSLTILRYSIRAIKDIKQRMHVGASGYVALDWAGIRDTVRQSRTIDTLGIILDLVISPKVVVEMPQVRTRPPVHDTVYKSRSMLLPILGAAVVGAVGGYFAHPQNTCPVSPFGGPENPPNMRVPDIGPRIGFYFRP
jgi:hypothetical protein